LTIGLIILTRALCMATVILGIYAARPSLVFFIQFICEAQHERGMI